MRNYWRALPVVWGQRLLIEAIVEQLSSYISERITAKTILGKSIINLWHRIFGMSIRGGKLSSLQFNIKIEARNSKQQKDIASAVDELRGYFPELNVRIEPESKGLVPEEVVLMVLVTVGSKVLATAVLRFLDKLWKRLRNKGISPILSSLDSVHRIAEDYLLNMGITDYRLVRRENKGLYVLFELRAKDASHYLYISRSDNQIIKYERVE